MTERLDLDQRKARVKERVSLVALVERHVKLSGSSSAKNRRGKCPFHSGNSASFSVKTGQDFAHCFGCSWNGDAIRFTMDIAGLSFMDALQELEASIGEGAAPAARGAGPVQRERNPTVRRGEDPVDSITMGRWIWKHARPDHRAVRRYMEGRGVPARMLVDDRLQAFRYLAECPCHAWKPGRDPRKVIHAPAVIALVTEARLDGEPAELRFVPVGLHVTYLDPSGQATMKRRAPWAKADDADPWLPKRRMLGPVGRGAVMLGIYRPDAALWVGEGNETVLSGMALAGAGDDDVGVATLSLDNLQGHPRLWQGRYGRIWPLYDVRPDPDKQPLYAVPGHAGPVVGLIDSDMSPLRGVKDMATGEPLGESLVERKGGPILRRAITGAERATMCGELFVKGWRAAGVHQVRAVRAPLGMDFNDAVRGEAA